MSDAKRSTLTVVKTAVTPAPIDADKLNALLASMDAWIDNDEPLMIEDVFDWRDQLAAALHREPRK